MVTMVFRLRTHFGPEQFSAKEISFGTRFLHQAIEMIGHLAEHGRKVWNSNSLADLRPRAPDLSAR